MYVYGCVFCVCLSVLGFPGAGTVRHLGTQLGPLEEPRGLLLLIHLSSCPVHSSLTYFEETTQHGVEEALYLKMLVPVLSGALESYQPIF